MKEIINILMRRDGLTKEEAAELIQECIEEMKMGNFHACEDVLGLEPDYYDYLFDYMF